MNRQTEGVCQRTDVEEVRRGRHPDLRRKKGRAAKLLESHRETIREGGQVPYGHRGKYTDQSEESGSHQSPSMGMRCVQEERRCSES